MYLEIFFWCLRMLRVCGMDLKSCWAIQVCLGLAILTADAHTAALAFDTSSNLEGSSKLLENLTLPLSKVSSADSTLFTNPFFMHISAQFENTSGYLLANESDDGDWYSNVAFTNNRFLNSSADSYAQYADSTVYVDEASEESKDDLVSKSIPVFPLVSTSIASKLSESANNTQIASSVILDKVQSTESTVSADDSQSAQSSESTVSAENSQSAQSAVSVDNQDSSYASGNGSAAAQGYHNTKSNNDSAVKASGDTSGQASSKSAEQTSSETSEQASSESAVPTLAQQSKKIKNKSAQSSHVKIDVGHTRCYEILERPRIIPALIAWTDGFLSGITRDTISDDKYISDMTNGVIQFCKQNPQAFYWNYIHSNYNVHGLAD